MALHVKRFGIGIVAVGVVWLALAFLASPAWAQVAELAVDKTDSPDPVTEGQIINYSIEVTNTGKAAATDVTLTDTLPAGTAFVSANTASGTCPTTPVEGDSGLVECNLGDIAAGASATVAIEVRATQAGTVENTAIADGTNTDPDQDTTRTRVLPDLVIDKFDDPDPVSGVEQLLLYTIRVQNQGNNPVSNVAVTDDLPLSQVDFVTLDSNDFICEITAGLVQCNLIDDLGFGEVARVEIVEPEVAGTIQNGAAVFFGQTQIDTAVAETTVQESAVTDEDGEDGDESDGNGDGSGNGEDGDGDGVIDSSIPDKDLPDTGGPSLLAVGFFLVAGAGLGTALLRRRF